MSDELKMALTCITILLIMTAVTHRENAERKAKIAEEQCLLQYNTTNYRQPNKIIFCLDKKTGEYIAIEQDKD